MPVASEVILDQSTLAALYMEVTRIELLVKQQREDLRYKKALLAALISSGEARVVVHSSHWSHDDLIVVSGLLQE